MPVLISPASISYIYFADVLSADSTSSNPVHCSLFALSAVDLEARRFDLDGQFFEITLSASGLPTVRDMDVLIYCVSWLANALFDERHKDLSRNLRFTARDFLDFSKRGNGGAQYDGLAQALDRLAGSKITTNIRPPDEIKECGDSFNLIRYEAERDRDGRIDAVSIELPARLYNCATDWTQVCAMHSDYFSLTPLHRLIYMLAKIQCGEWQPWVVSLNELHRLTGCSSPLRKFKNSVKGLLTDNAIPEYQIEMDAQETTVTFHRLPWVTPGLVPIPVNRPAFKRMKNKKVNSVKRSVVSFSVCCKLIPSAERKRRCA
ncbi:Replication initiator protein A [Candidatus Nitrotoga sp. HW29]|uniref:replication initiator protein A n=1 Tax=Candidatus Nitrotoga sp. HW29 TaxID=2886963 RepID=UPI001EF28732|nr:replication initiator protein A [Candidatus Nitrotoga sp. HW29]CAH1903485.1 Replication initiator protein A [Candidatus Nitrotoga sp. HW29]